ncbi:MAG: ribbon-helix-helix protein, CopG family [Crenarchaeota archaeon]|nr:ribbon-helix-helix protein, CopG family [Thermoproteota archaeon]
MLVPRSVIVTFKIPVELLHQLDDLVSRGLFASRSEALRRALALLLQRYSSGEEGTGYAYGYEAAGRGARRAKETKTTHCINDC